MFHSNGQKFPKHYLMTLGVDFCVKGVDVPEADVRVEFQIFDCSGQEIYGETLPSYWEGATSMLMVYDVTRPHTLEACVSWHARVMEALGIESLPGILVANKMDLRERIVVKRDQGKEMASRLGMELLETSSIDGMEVEAPFQQLAKLVVEARTAGM